MTFIMKRAKIIYLEGEAILPTNLHKDQVEAFAHQVANVYQFGVGEDPRDLVKALGGRLHYQSLGEMIDESGSIYVHGSEDFDILLPHYTSPTRDRFTVGHELGHYFLHSDQGEKPLIATRQGSTRIEWEANWFAAQLLMPKNRFSQICKRTDNDFEIAGVFQVSVDAVRVRRKALGL